MTVALAVTVTARHPGRYVDAARARASAWGLPFLPRTGGLPGEAAALLVLGADGWTLRSGEDELRFSPGLAAVRIKRLGARAPGAVGPAVEDHLVRLGALGPGDAVLDATFGLGVDALVCAHAVGPGGRVLGVEASLPLQLLASEGLRAARAGSRVAELRAGAAPLEVVHGRALDVMRALPAQSVDCVFFDPMFDRPKAAAPAFDLLRRFALHEPLDAETLAQARRVARRWVVVKGGRHGRELERLGLAPQRGSRYSPTLWARVRGGADDG